MVTDYYLLMITFIITITAPNLLSTYFVPGIQGIKIPKATHWLVSFTSEPITEIRGKEHAEGLRQGPMTTWLQRVSEDCFPKGKPKYHNQREKIGITAGETKMSEEYKTGFRVIFICP